MIKFFRQIRYKLMEQNKISRYLKYAMGEIILVVFGILIALTINNWNERRQTRQAELNYAASIKNDLKSDQENIQYIVKEIEKRAQAYVDLMEQLKYFDTIRDSKPLFLLMRNNFGFPDYRASDNTVETLTNSGNIEIISSKPIRDAIQDYYDAGEMLYIHQNFINNLGVESPFGTFFNYLECEKGIEQNTAVPFGDKSKENLPETYAYLHHWVWNLKSSLTMLSNLQKKNKALISLLDRKYN